MKAVFLRLLDADDKAATLRAAIMEPASARHRRCEVDPASFVALPLSSFAYSSIASLTFTSVPPSSVSV